MAGNKAIYAVAVAIFAGLSLIGVTNLLTQQNTTPLNIGSDSQAFAQTVGIRQNIISVTGTATRDVAPDQVVINFGVETQALTAVEASQKNAAAMNNIVKAVKGLGISDDEISTSRFNVYPNYDTTGRVITGYSVSNIVSVKTDQITKASQIIDTSVDAGANHVDSIFFTLSDKLDKQVSDDLIASAVQDGKMKAEKALAPLGKKIIGVKSVSLSEFGMPPPVSLFDIRTAAKGAEFPTPIFKAEQQVSTSVSVIFLID